MRPCLLFVALMSATIVVPFNIGANAQNAGTAAASLGTGVVLTKLSPPLYPPLARQARITGDVRVLVGIRRDGSVESAELLSGHPMLVQAALDSARKSIFECRGCFESVTQYPLTYAFEIWADCRFGPNCQAVEPRAPEVSQSEHKITITVEPACTCDPARIYVQKKIRSAKCLYLWKCGLGEITDAPVR